MRMQEVSLMWQRIWRTKTAKAEVSFPLLPLLLELELVVLEGLMLPR